MISCYSPLTCRITLIGAILLLMTGCQMTRFYHQAIIGQSRLLLDRESIQELIQAETSDPALKHRLHLVRAIIQFAQEAGLPAEGAYTTYVETGQPYVVWNVFAAPAHELKLLTSCFPIAGCVSYRGFFEKEMAREYAHSLEQEGYDVYMGGVTAYSTLGWFDDPLLDTFLFQPEQYLAALLFHELAHRLVYVKDDTRFNESLATSVEQYLLKAWLQQRGEEESFKRYLASEQRRDSVLHLIESTRVELHKLYGSGLPPAEINARKKRILQDLVSAYRELSSSWPEGREYGAWMSSPINNAKLETVADYNSWVPVMLRYLEMNGLAAFTLEMKRLASLKSSEREAALGAIRPSVPATIEF